jgi:hypothetical protein
MTRTLETPTLDAAARYYAGLFLADSGRFDRNWVMKQFYNFTFKDEHEYLVGRIKGELGSTALADFERRAGGVFAPREDKVFAELLATKLAIDPNGNHLEGRVGTTNIGSRGMGEVLVEVETPDSIRRRHVLGLDKSHRKTYIRPSRAQWPIYMGEGEERAAGRIRSEIGVGPGADPLPPNAEPLPLSALNTNVSIAFAQAGVDAALDLLDEGTVDGFIEGRTGAQPVDPDFGVTGTLLFSLDLGTPGFGASTDGAPGALATAAAIADDVSADATNTLSYCRAYSANVLITILNAHIDGEAGTSGADFNFNTLAIVSGATISMTAWTVTQPQGPTAT